MVESPQGRVEAAVAVILREDGAVLLGQRPPGKSWEGWWEFPGGKVEDGESAAQALKREVHEELGIEVVDFSRWITREFSYPERHVRLNFFTVRSWRGEPHGRENQALSWANPFAPRVGPLLPANAPVLQALQLPARYAITNLAEMGEAPFFAALKRALENGLGLVQIREKSMSPDQLLAFSRRVVALAHAHGARVVVNGAVGMALECGADGVHFSSAALRKLQEKPLDLICGASCHDPDELAMAASLQMDYALLGPVMPTRTHPDAQVLGWAGFANCIAGLPMPVYALGGLDGNDLPEAWKHGAHGVAMMRGAWA